MLGSLFLFLLSLPQGGKGGEMGEKGGGRKLNCVSEGNK